MNLGAHVSIAGGLHKCFECGESIGASVIQIFTKNATQWKAREITPSEASLFRNTWKKSKIRKVIAHSAYLINLANPGESEWRKSLDAFIIEIKRAELLGIKWLVIHPGSSHREGEDKAIVRIADAINNAFLQTANSKTGILLETISGQGSGIGYRFEHLKAIIDLVENKSRIGVCIDTAHIFSAGYNIKTPAGFRKTINQFSQIVGFSKLKAIHLNDSLKPCGSRIDRHANIGEGEIGIEAFRYIVNDPRFKNIPLILETPGGDPMFMKNLALLRNLRKMRD